jgi:hypothetical protein
MAYEGPQICIPGLKAGAAIVAADQYKFVKLSAARTVILCAGVTDRPIGVLQNAPVADGDEVTVCCIGVTKVQGDADLAFGAQIGTSADGQAATYAAADTTKYIVGTVILDNSAAAGLATAVIDCANVRTLA